MRLEVPEMAREDRMQRRPISGRRSQNREGGKYGCGE